MRCYYRGIWTGLLISEDCYLLIILVPYEFFKPALADSLSMGFEWQQISSSVQDSLSILVDLYNAVVWMVSAGPLTPESSTPFTNPFVTLLRTPITTDITATFMFYSFILIP